MAPFPDDIHQAAHETARGAHRAARGARRTAYRATFRTGCERTPWFFGTLLIGLGLLFLLDNLDIIEARFVFRNLWPLLLTGFGLSRLFYGVGGEKVFGAIATAFGGLWLADRLFDLDVNIIGVFWPLILIGLGISMLFGRRRGWGAGLSGPPAPPGPPTPPLPGVPSPPPFAGFADSAATADQATDRAYDQPDSIDQSATLREVAIMAGIERKNVSQAFRGGTITAVMGSVDLDLRDCRMSEAPARIWIQAIMGNVALRLPSNWTIESRLATILGNLEDRSDRPVESTPRRLILEGSVFMGQVEIRN
jgi:hypothetical protein